MRLVRLAVLLTFVGGMTVTIIMHNTDADRRIVQILHAARRQNAMLSIELADAPPGRTPEARVYKWLRRHRREILEAENRFKSDRRAIAGVIAYEALEDVSTSRLWMLNSSGPGKVHYRGMPFYERKSVAEEVERSGLLPRQSLRRRKEILQSTLGASLYIAAIMETYDAIASRQRIDIQCRPDILTTLYTAWNFSSLERMFNQRRPHVLANNAAGRWVAMHLPLLRNSVGMPPFCH